MIGGLWVVELTIILCIVVVLFGAGRLAGIGAGLGKGIRNFKKEVGTDQKNQKKELADQTAEKAEIDEEEEDKKTG